MDNKFTVINSTNEDKNKEMDHVCRVAKMNEIWERQYHNSVLRAIEKNKDTKIIADYLQEDLMRIAFSGIRFICSLRDVRQENEKLGTGYQQSLQESQVTFQFINAVFTVCGYLTLRNFVTTFPIEKYYKGAKWEEKDYFYTMDVLKKMDWDEPIGRDELSELLWDYMNKELRHAYIEFTNAMSTIYRAQTGKGLAEQWCEDMGIPTYTMNNETGIMKNNQTGDIVKVGKKSNMHIVE